MIKHGIQKPIMGDVEKQSDDTYTAWTGGQPRSGWLGLVVTAPPSLFPTQFQPTGIGSSTKAQYYRTIGLSTKYSRKEDRLTFQRKVMDHMVTYGMDTITYLQDPAEPTKMI